MKDDSDKANESMRLEGELHEEFLELCALTTSGNVTEEEQKRLSDHLASCAKCPEAMKEFALVVEIVVPALAYELASDLTDAAPKQDPSFSTEAAEASFLKRLSKEKDRPALATADTDSWRIPLVVRRSHRLRRSFDRYHFWMPLAAGLILCLSLSILTYRMGKNRGYFLAANHQPALVPIAVRSQDSLEAALRERDATIARLAEQDKAIAALRCEVGLKLKEKSKLQVIESEQEAALATSAKTNTQLLDEHDRVVEQAKASQEALTASEQRLKHLEQERSEDVVRAASLETKVTEMSRSLAEQKQMNDDLQELLAKDRDIRELMGARDLYITEVRDVLTTGETRKAFGRLFYTKGKSLVFYAYDLNDLPGLRRASTFQVWGNRGPDRNQALKLGIFYEDNASKKRWVMKVNDKRTLDQIDTVFVTIEPPGGSNRPSGMPLMYAYLKVNANHP
jgi:hypothetical protein